MGYDLIALSQERQTLRVLLYSINGSVEIGSLAVG